MWVGMQATAGATVIGAALVVAGLHGSATGAAPTAAVAPSGSDAYRPPANPLPDTAHSRVRVLPAAPKPARPRTHVVAAKPRSVTRSHQPAARHTPPHKNPATQAAPAQPQPSFSAALAAAVARIPTYTSGAARWVVSSKYAFWGTADWYHDVLYVSPDVPRDKLYDVAVHEWSHELSVLDYGGDVSAATKAMNAWFGGSGLTGAERAADCMAILQGATWTHYTTCDNATWRKGAAKLVAGKQL